MMMVMIDSVLGIETREKAIIFVRAFIEMSAPYKEKNSTDQEGTT